MGLLTRMSGGVSAEASTIGRARQVARAVRSMMMAVVVSVVLYFSKSMHVFGFSRSAEDKGVFIRSQVSGRE